MITRRGFLKLAGVLTIPVSIPQANAPLMGRALLPVPARSHPGVNSPEISRLLPDSIHSIQAIEGGWARVPAGFVPETALQPILDLRSSAVREFPAWVEVAAPYAALRAWCAADAPLIDRPGHGAILRAIRLLDDRVGRRWLEVELRQGKTAWIQATHARPINLLNDIGPKSSIYQHTIHGPKERVQAHCTISGHQLSVVQGNLAPWRFPVACPADLPRGEYRITRKIPGAHNTDHIGVPWVMDTDRGVRLQGVYWHNHFGCESGSTNIELPVLAARFVYELLSENDLLIVI